MIGDPSEQKSHVLFWCLLVHEGAVAVSDSLENLCGLCNPKTHINGKSLVDLDKDSYNAGLFFFKMCFHLLRSVHLYRTIETWKGKSRVVWALFNYSSDQILISTRHRRKCYFYYPLLCTCLHIYPGVRGAWLIIFVGNQDNILTSELKVTNLLNTVLRNEQCYLPSMNKSQSTRVTHC
jgi:hypothetical protein